MEALSGSGQAVIVLFYYVQTSIMLTGMFTASRRSLPPKKKPVGRREVDMASS